MASVGYAINNTGSSFNARLATILKHKKGDKMRALDGRLAIDTKYTLVSMYYGSLADNSAICENCGKLIANMADIKNEAGKTFTVGQDCCEELLKTTSNDFWEFKQKQKEYNKKRTLVRKYAKAIKEDMADIHDGFLYFYTMTDSYKRNGKELEIIRVKTWSTRYREDYAMNVLNEFGVKI